MLNSLISVGCQTQRVHVTLSVPEASPRMSSNDTAIQHLTFQGFFPSRGSGDGWRSADRSLSCRHQRVPRTSPKILSHNIFDVPEPTWASNGQTQQLLRLNQLGGSLAGLIVHEKSFFCLASEAYRQVWGSPTSGDVPSAAFRASIPSSSPVAALVRTTRTIRTTRTMTCLPRLHTGGSIPLHRGPL